MSLYYRLPGTALIFLILLAATSWAETRYISDQLVVSLRAKPQNNAEIITYLRTDTPVEVLEDVGDFMKIRTKEGETGYIKQNYLISETPKSTVIRRLEQERDRLIAQANETKALLSSTESEKEQTLLELEALLDQARKELETSQKVLQASQEELQKTNAAYKALQKDAENVIAITKERDELRASNQELTAKITKLEDEVNSLIKTGVIKWFLAGGGVLFFGWIIGRLSGGRRRRSLY